MPAYILVMRNEPVQQPEEFAEYQRRTRASPPPLKLIPRVVYGAMTPLEGAAPDGMVMLEFEDVETARAWYESPEYQQALPHRLKAADHTAFIVEGLDMKKLD